ncbi:hypothetical protein DPSP01_001799 [Paraphaeosphaeria sporulosa]|uniref:Rhodopsin domain-containing protein n=1 Tax=Paraphaeosphaeria sporulosa TaxID=1460663 RepID=A0A177BU54_9PLEO|nr:uncharacterized protein CC84DRAFT_1223717 [Paraphaeosphaeria sporulosa]OAF98540.1 hypothetical protein CC84DRAFT_1223717 [Paraphaeosphaeria sporulosa]
MSTSAEFRDLNHFIDQAGAAAWPIFIIATIVFILRTISRVFYSKASLDWEDYVISISWVLDVVRMVTFQLALSATRKVDLNDLAGTLPNASFWSLFTDAWSFLSVTSPKVGVAFLLVRIFRPRKWVANTILGMSIGLFIVCIAGFFICFVQCNPIAGQWDPYSHPKTKCWPRNVQVDYSLMGSSTSAFLDLVFALYPGFVIWGLQLPLWKRLSTMGFMCLGVGAFAFAVVKVTSNTTLLGEPTVTEFAQKALHIALWNSIENDFVMLAACLPSVRPVLRQLGLFTRTHLSTSRPTRMTSPSISERSLRRGDHGEPYDGRAVELGHHPRSMNKSIQIKHDVSLEWEQAKPNFSNPSSQV